MQGMKKRLRKIFILGIALHLAVLFSIVVPNHHHEDHAEHADCIVCIMAHQPAFQTATFPLIVIANLVSIGLVLPGTKPRSQVLLSFQTRAPPLL